MEYHLESIEFSILVSSCHFTANNPSVSSFSLEAKAKVLKKTLARLLAICISPPLPNLPDLPAYLSPQAYFLFPPPQMLPYFLGFPDHPIYN